MPYEMTDPELLVKHPLSMQKMEQKTASPFVSSIGPSFHSTEIQIPVERQVGFWRHEPVFEQNGTDNVSSITNNGTIGSALGPNGTHKLGSLESSQVYPIKQQEIMSERKSIESEISSTLSTASWKTIEQKLSAQRNTCVNPITVCIGGDKVDLGSTECETELFSSSLSEAFENKLRVSSSDDAFGHSLSTAIAQFEDNDPFAPLEEMEAQILGNLLPDDDELFSGVIDGIECVAQTNNIDEMEDFDLFSSIGGLELEGEDGLGCFGNKNGPDLVFSMSNGQQLAAIGSFAGEHPFGEHPSRTLFVRNINSNVEDTELRSLFEQYGDIRALYTACKHRGFVMVAYYDIRSARNAMRALQNKPLRRRKLDIHFSIPKDNPSEKAINQGTLVVFNLDSSVSNDDLRHIFGAYGEIKEIRETPHKQHHRFIEFYDVRAAEAALRELNKCDIAGKRIKLEPSRPGGARRLMQQLSQDLELDEFNLLQQQGNPSNNSPLNYYGLHSSMSVPVSCNDNGAIKDHISASCPIDNQFVDSASQRFSSASMIPGASLPGRVTSIHSTGNHSSFVEVNHSLGQMNGFPGVPSFHPHSLPEYRIMGNSIPYSSPNTISSMTASIFPRHAEAIPGSMSTVHSIGPNGFRSHSFENGNGCCAVDGHHLMWRNPNSYHAHVPSQMMWPNSTSFANGLPVPHPPQQHGFSSAHNNLVNTVLPSHHHQVGSAPTAIWDRQHTFAGDSSESTAFIPGSLGSMGLSNGMHPLEVSSNMFPRIGRNGLDPSISAGGGVGLSSSNHRYQTFSHRDFMISASPLFGSPGERFRGRRTDPSNQVDSKKQYELDVDRILHGEDTRTTLMIKNIPNKYTSKMLLAAIDEHHKGTYDFIYLPIDFKNKCNVGYAFINMIDALHIIPFYETFNGKKWEKFNSEKVASLAYARIQGKAALIAHFQNSSLMNEDKRCRPILFHTDGPNAGDQEPFPVGLNVRTRPGKLRSSTIDDNQESPSSSPPIEEASSFHVNDQSAGLTAEKRMSNSGN